MSSPYDHGYSTNSGDIGNLQSDIEDVKKSIYDLEVKVTDMVRRIDALTVQLKDIGGDIARNANKLHNHMH